MRSLGNVECMRIELTDWGTDVRSFTDDQVRFAYEPIGAYARPCFMINPEHGRTVHGYTYRLEPKTDPYGKASLDPDAVRRQAEMYERGGR